jgi:hypothetical protein
VSTIPLPALDIKPAQPPSVLDQLGHIMALRNLMGDQQLQQGQVQLQQAQLQGEQQKNQMAAIQLQDQKAMSAAMQAWDGKDINDLPGLALKQGASAQTVFGLKQQLVTYQKNLQDMTKDKLANEATKSDVIAGHIDTVKSLPPDQQPQAFESAKADLIKRGYMDPQLAQGLQYQGPQQLDVLEKFYQSHSQLVESALKGAQTGEQNAQASAAQAEEQNRRAQLPGITAQSNAQSATAVPLAQLNVKQKQAEIAATQASTAKTRVETANLGDQPIFAVDPNTNERVMTTRPEAQAKGYTNPVPVKEGDVSKETDARAMINDVQLNKSRYLAAMQRVYSEPMTNGQKNALVALTPERLGLDIGHVGSLSIGFSLPDVMQKVSNASAFSVLTPAQKQAVVGYYSTLASVPAAQKALTNIGRSNKEMMDLDLRTIPTPIMDAGTFGTMLDRFQGNIEQTSKKTVRIPGMPSTSDIRNTYEGQQQQQQGPGFSVQPFAQPPSLRAEVQQETQWRACAHGAQ